MTNPINPDIAPEILQRYFSLASHTDNNQRLPKDQVAAYLSAEKDPLKQSIVSEVPSINEAVRNLVAPDGETERLLQSLLLGEKGNPRSLDGNELELLQFVRANVAHYLSENSGLSDGHKKKLKSRLGELSKRIDAAKKLSHSSGAAGSSSAAGSSQSAFAPYATAEAAAEAAKQQQRENNALPAAVTAQRCTEQTFTPYVGPTEEERERDKARDLEVANKILKARETVMPDSQGFKSLPPCEQERVIAALEVAQEIMNRYS